MRNKVKNFLSSRIDFLQFDENILVKNEQFRMKKPLVAVVIICFCLSTVWAVVLAENNADFFRDNFYTTLLHGIPGNAVETIGPEWSSACYCDICCRINYANSVEEFVFEKMLSEPQYLIPVIFAVLFCCFVYFASRSFELIVTDKRILCKVACVKDIDIPLSLVLEGRPSKYIKGLIVSIPSKKLFFPMVKNSDDVCRIINNLLSNAKSDYIIDIDVSSEKEKTENENNISADGEGVLKKEKIPISSVKITKTGESNENDYSTPLNPNKLKFFFTKRRKQACFAGVCILIICINVFVFSDDSNNGNSSNNNYTIKTTYTQKNDYDESYLETLAVSELYDELVNHKSGLLTYSYDIDSTRYSIGSIVKNNGVYIVRGTFTLYDYYGKISSNHYKETFTVKISGSSATCTTSLD